MDNQKTNLQTVVQTGHSTEVWAIFICPQSEYLVSVASDSTVKLWELKSGKLIRNFSGHAGWVVACAISSDRKHIATSSWDHTVRLWDLETGTQLQSFEVTGGESVCFSPDGNCLVGGSEDGSAYLLWDRLEATRETPLPFSFSGHADKVKSVCIYDKENKKYLATGSKDGTAKLWDFQTGELIQTYTAHPDEIGQDYGLEFWESHPLGIRSVCFTPDGKYLVTCSNDGTARLWDIEDRDRTTPFHTFYHSGKVRSVSVSPDGLLLATAGDDATAKLWNLNDLNQTEPVAIFEGGHFGPMTAVQFSPNGKYLATGSKDTFIKLWDIETKEVSQIFTGKSFAINTAVMRNDRKYLATGHYDNVIKIWDLAAGKLSKTLRSNAASRKVGLVSGITSLQFSHDNQYLLSGSGDGTAKLWDIENGAPLHTYTGNCSFLNSARISQDHKLIVAGGNTPIVSLWNTDSEALEDTFEGDTQWVSSVDINSEKGYFAFACDHGGEGPINRVVLLDLNTNEAYDYDGHTDRVRSVRISTDGKYMVTGSCDNTAMLWDLDNNNGKARLLEGHTGWVNTVDINGNGAHIVTGSDDTTAILWDGTTGTERFVLEGHSAGIYATITEDAKYVMTGSRDSTTKIWDVQSGLEVATLVAIGEEDWVVLTPSGLFDASPGAMQKMHYVVGLEVIELDQLKNRYWQPGLLATLMGFSGDEIKEVSTLDEVPLPPKVLSLKIKDEKLEVRLEVRNGGIGKTKFFINNKEISLFKDDGTRISDANPERKTEFIIDLKPFENYFENGHNTIAIQCWNEDNWLPSQLHFLDYEKQGGEKEEASLFAVFVGTSKYRNDNLSLSFPDQDATYLSDALKIVGEHLFPNRVHLKLLTTEKPQAATFSNKENIRKAFEEIVQQARPQDIVVIYFTGHGANYDDGKKPQYYYLTHETLSSDLSDPSVRKKATISSEELTDWVNNIPARKQVLIFDTCYSGKIVDSLKSKSAIDQTRERAMERMKDRTGTYVLTGSAADKVSYEASNYGQGLLTYALLMGMKGAELSKPTSQTENSVDVMKLFSYCREQVEHMSKEFSVVQKPTLRAPLNVESFDIGIAPELARQQIKLALPKPVFVQSNFMNSAHFLDDLNISEGLDQYLAGSIGIGNRPQAIFVNVTSFPGAHRVRGLYEKTANGYALKGKVYKESENLGDFAVEGEGMEDLVPKIAREVEIFAFEKTPYKIPSPEEAVLLEKGVLDDLAAAETSPHFGYKENFIEGFKIPLPRLNSEQKKDIAKLLAPGSGNETVLHYQYYSVVQSASRRLPYFSACNINGEAFLRLDRKDADMPFITDKRIALEHQMGDEFYKNTVLGEQDKTFTHFFDRGHMTKREDAQWAAEPDDAVKTANSARGARLTFFFTNAVPQIGRFNRGIWNSLETYILKTASAVKKGSGNRSYNINLFTGPVLGKTDPKVPLNGELVQIPALFWKVVYYKKDSDGKLYHVGFLISQDPEWEASGLKKKEATADEEAKLFSEFKDDQPFQVPVSEIARLTDLTFFSAIDPFQGQRQGAAITETVRLRTRDAGSEAEGLGYELAGLVW